MSFTGVENKSRWAAHSNITSVEKIYSKVCNKNVDSMLQIISLCKNREKHDKHGLIKKKEKVEIEHPS